jgi:hypothetical protein
MSNHSKQFLAFTTKADGLLREIVNDCAISIPFVPGAKSNLKKDVVKVKALWDTGATNCAITKKPVELLRIKPIGKAIVNHADGSSEQNVYLVNVYLPNDVIIPNVRVTECVSSAGNFDMIIGMDIILMGDFP